VYLGYSARCIANTVSSVYIGMLNKIECIQYRVYLYHYPCLWSKSIEQGEFLNTPIFMVT
jgi:hypothetical protein